MILMDRIYVPAVPLEVYSFLNFVSSYSLLIFKFTANSAFIKALSKSLVLGRGRFSSPGGSVADPDPWNPYHFPGSGSVSKMAGSGSN